MYIRLAFSVAAHMDPDILIVDEVLAVGDADFQKKCLGRMQSIAEKTDKTVLFVSHNLDAIQRVCSKAMYLKAGSLIFHGDAGAAIDTYRSRSRSMTNLFDLSSATERWGTGRARIVGFAVMNNDGKSVNVIRSGGCYRFEISYLFSESVHPNARATANIEFSDEKGNIVMFLSSDYQHREALRCHDTGTFVCTIEEFNLASGDYYLSLYLGGVQGEPFDGLNKVGAITVAGGDYFGTGHPGFPSHCKTLTRSLWSTHK
jgi:lipopolysaccharide transport system ATP-binding protein